MELISLIVITSISAACFAVLFRTPRNYFFHTVLVGTISGCSIHLFPEHVHLGYATLAVAFMIGSISHIFARLTGQPAQVFLIPGIIFLVPGTYLYRGFTLAMDNDLVGMTNYMRLALVITFAISFGLLLANWIVPPRREL